MRGKSEECKKVTMMTDGAGNPSAMRYMSMFAFVVATILAIIVCAGWKESGNNTELVLYFLVAAFAPKAVQKFAEKE